MKRYKLPANILNGAELDGFPVPNTANVFRFIVDGVGVLELAGELLTEVAPPIPEEPGPGAYEIGVARCLHFAHRDDRDEQYWCVDHPENPGGGWWFTWAELWTKFGGPDVTIRRAVFLEPVELPWEKQVSPMVVLRVNDEFFSDDVTGGSATGVYLEANWCDGKQVVAPTLTVGDVSELAAALLTATGDLA